jgi:Tfp pilus assembly protein PilN
MNRIDFLPKRIRLRRVHRRRLKLQAILSAVILVALVLLGFVRQGKISRAQAELRMFDERTTTLQDQLATKQSLESQRDELLIKQRIENNIGSHVTPVDVLSELNKLLPETMVLTGLELETLELQPEEAKTVNAGPRPVAVERTHVSGRECEKRIRLSITGLALSDVDVANFIGQLSASPLFEEVTMGYAKDYEFRGRNVRQFQASCYIVR